MKAKRRWRLEGLKTLSWVLCVCVIGLWVRSYWHEDGVGWRWGKAHREGQSEVRVHCAGGVVMISWEGEFMGMEEDEPGPIWYTQPPSEFEPSRLKGFAGFDWETFATATADRRFSMVHVFVPLWFMAAFAPVVYWCAGAPAMRRRQRRARGECVGCGYDLRATPGRCPECGMVASSERSAGVCGVD